MKTREARPTHDDDHQRRPAPRVRPAHSPAETTSAAAPSVPAWAQLSSPTRAPCGTSCHCGGCQAKALRPLSVPRAADYSASVHDPSGSHALDGVVDALSSRTGRAIEPEARAHFEASVGHDLTDVRVHDDSTAHRAAGQLQANAFAFGRDIYFGAGKGPSSSTTGWSLLGHELAHVLQQDRRGAWPTSTGDQQRLETSAKTGSTASAGADGVAPGLQLDAQAMVWSPHVDGYGHAALKLCDGTYISWWPSGGGSKAQQYWTGRPGAGHGEAEDLGPGGENKPPDNVYNLGCGCLDEGAMKAWYDKEFVSNPDPKWAVLRNSCSDVAHQALNVGSGFANPCYLSISHSNLFWTPKDLGAYAECQERWCASKKAGVANATGRYLWENAKEVAGGGLANSVRSLFWKGEIVKKAVSPDETPAP